MTMSSGTARERSDPGEAWHRYDRRVARSALIVTGIVVGSGLTLALLWRLRLIVLLILVSLFLASSAGFSLPSLSMLTKVVSWMVSPDAVVPIAPGSRPPCPASRKTI